MTTVVDAYLLETSVGAAALTIPDVQCENMNQDQKAAVQSAIQTTEEAFDREGAASADVVGAPSAKDCGASPDESVSTGLDKHREEDAEITMNPLGQNQKNPYSCTDISLGEKQRSNTPDRSALPPINTLQEANTQFRLSFNQGPQSLQEGGQDGLVNTFSSLSFDEEGQQQPATLKQPDVHSQPMQNGLIGDSLREHNSQQGQSRNGSTVGDSPATIVTGHHHPAADVSIFSPSPVQQDAHLAQQTGHTRPGHSRTITPPEGLHAMEHQSRVCSSQRQMIYAMSPLQTPSESESETAATYIEQGFPQDITCAGASARTHSSANSSTPHSSLGSYSYATNQAASVASVTGSSMATPPSNLMAPTESGSSTKYNAQHISQHRASVRPKVYSAIGSLESYNASSPGSLNARILAAQQQYHFVRSGPLLPPSGHAAGSKGSRDTKGSSHGTSVGVSSVGESKPRADSSSLLAQEERKKSQRRSQGEQQSGERTSQAEQHYDAIKMKSDGEKNVGAIATGTSESHRKDLEQGPVLKNKDRKKGGKKKKKKTVKIDTVATMLDVPSARQSQQAVEMFRPSCDAYTPRMERKKIEYKPAEHRTPVQKMSAPMGTISRPNFRDALRRVAMIIQQHVEKINRRFETGVLGKNDNGLFKASMREAFAEENFATPRYKCTVLRLPMGRPGVVYGLRKIKVEYTVPTVEEIYEFGHQLFKSVQLSSECSIVCLIYVERLMEVAKVPLLSDTWRPIFMCGLLLASKVWQDLSSWNIEFASVYPQFSLDAINRLELQFLKNVNWDLFISSSLYAKYYFALRSLLEKQDFRQRYNRMTGAGGVAASEALKIQKRTERVKEEALLQLSRSM